jgi:hypothetical protein
MKGIILLGIREKIADLTDQLAILETFDRENEPEYEEKLEELFKLTGKLHTFYETWPKNFPRWFT